MNYRYQVVKITNDYIEHARFIIKYWKRNAGYNTSEDPHKIVTNAKGLYFESMEEAKGYLKEILWPKLEDQEEVVFEC